MVALPEAAAYCGVSGPTFKAYCPLPPIKLGKRILWDLRAIDRWLDALSAPCSIGSSIDWLERLDNADAYKGN